MERFLESPGKKGYNLSPGKPWNWVSASPGNSWKNAFESLYEPCNYQKVFDCLINMTKYIDVNIKMSSSSM